MITYSHYGSYKNKGKKGKEKKEKKVHLTKFNKIRIENFLNLGKIVEAQVQVI